MLSLLKYELFSRWAAVLSWGAGLALLGVTNVGIYPQFEDKLAVLADIAFYQALRIDMTTFEGLIASNLILNIPVILAIYVIVAGCDTLAGEEDRGTLELIVTMPLKRWQVVSMKAISLAVVTFLMLVVAGVCCGIALISIRNSVDVNVTPTQLFFAVLSAWPITLAILMIGLFFSACAPNRLTASMATTIYFIFSYFIVILAGLVEAFDGISRLSLFYYLDTSAKLFTKGVQPSDVLTLLGVAAVFFVLALISFQRRDITVGQWPWQRAKAQDTLT